MCDRLLAYIAFIFILRHVQGTGNFALRKPAFQSTTLSYKNFNWTADKAVDGNMQCGNPEESMSCSATQNADLLTNHDWEVDIGHQIIMKTITVYGRTDVTDQLEGVKLYIGNATKPWTYNLELPSSSANKTHFTYEPNYIIARFISMRRNGKILTICEVTVEGECKTGTYGFNCNETCGQCINGNNTCSQLNGMCKGGCQAGWEGERCKSGCDMGKFGYNCNEACGNCLNGTISCSTLDGRCSSGCDYGWQGNDCKKRLEKISQPDSETKFPGGAVGGAVAALVLIAVIVIVILVFHRKRKRNNNETSAEMTNAVNYANLVVENLAKTATTGYTSHDTSRIRNGPIGAIPANRGVMEPDAHVNNDYEKLHVHTESTEFHYSSIDQAFMHQQEMKSLENCSSYVQSLQSLEGALRSVEEEITVVLNKKEKLLSRELERARGNKIGDKKKVKDSTFPDKDRDLTIHNYVQTLQSLEEELRNLEEKKKCLLERKEILLREELVKTTESGI